MSVIYKRILVDHYERHGQYSTAFPPAELKTRKLFLWIFVNTWKVPVRDNGKLRMYQKLYQEEEIEVHEV